MSLIFHDNSLLVLLWCFNHFIIHVGDSRLEKAYKERCHTLHQPRGVAITVRINTTLSTGQVSGNRGQLLLGYHLWFLDQMVCMGNHFVTSYVHFKSRHS